MVRKPYERFDEEVSENGVPMFHMMVPRGDEIPRKIGKYILIMHSDDPKAEFLECFYADYSPLMGKVA